MVLIVRTCVYRRNVRYPRYDASLNLPYNVGTFLNDVSVGDDLRILLCLIRRRTLFELYGDVQALVQLVQFDCRQDVAPITCCVGMDWDAWMMNLAVIQIRLQLLMYVVDLVHRINVIGCQINRVSCLMRETPI